MQRKLIVTGDGSHSIEIPGLKLTYHSIHGAIQESKHVFIDAGFSKVSDARAFGETSDTIRVFEMGFGTGLNALLTLIEAEKIDREIFYEAIEPFPLDMDEARGLNYCEVLNRSDLQKTFGQLHRCPWEREIMITPKFFFTKRQGNLLNFGVSITTGQFFDLVYFDAFDPNIQPELWTEIIFRKMFSILKPGGILITYSSKGAVRRAMQSAGFNVEKLPGPPGKREIVRAIKN